jgi:hypothetical protein
LEQAALGPYKLAADQFAERSCAAEASQELRAWEEPLLLVAHSPKPQDARPEELMLPAGQADVSA